MKPATVVVKKYGNRRLYDTSASRYVNLEELATMVRNGTDVQVVDANSGEDLTRVTLTQIIVEDAKGRPAGLPLEVLRQFIMASDNVRQEFMSWYLKSAFDTYEKVQNAVHSGLTEVRSAAMSPLDLVRNFIQGPAAATPPPASPEVLELRQRVADLEERLKQASRRPQRRKAKASRSA